MKICICFFGVINRSLKYTIGNIKKNIFQELEKRGIEYDVYIHNIIVDNVSTNPTREGIQEDIQHLEDFSKHLKYKERCDTLQSKIDKSINWNYLKKFGDAFWMDKILSDRHYCGWNVLYNAIRELISIQKVTKLWLNKQKYDFYLYLRPDIYYETPLDIDSIINNLDKFLIINSNLPTNALSDVVYGGNYDIMKIIGKRIEWVPTILNFTQKPYQSELLIYYIINAYKFPYKYFWMNEAPRVRANGELYRV